MGHGLVGDETLVLVAGLIAVVVLLATATGAAWCPCTRVAIGDEEERAGACGWGECGGGGGRERTHGWLAPFGSALAGTATGNGRVTGWPSRAVSHENDLEKLGE